MENLQQWQKIKGIVGSALERPTSERAAYLDRMCSQDKELRKEVESLLSAYQDAEQLSEAPWKFEASKKDTEPKVIGPYRLLTELGVGGMGQVWLAEQTEPVRRQVALKLIRAGMYDAATVQRFKAEGQSLAIMDHPAIAKVFDAGTTSAGQPYLVMEYIDGVAITAYCDTMKLNIRERQQLFIHVCEGVQHAHQKAVIHRDLKQSNILIVEVDGKPFPRIIDFGLAKATSPLIPGETLFTQVGAFLGTPGYVSPEQADPEIRDVDTRTDVYSLGAILYELLTGFLPFDTAEYKQQRPEEFLRKLREEDPLRPSTKISAERERATPKAQSRNTEAKQLITLLRGDLDWITMKALEKDRERRYASPSQFASDIANYLENQPVIARPVSTAYRVRKYVRRNRVGVAVFSGALVLLMAFAVMQAMELRRITRERDRADRIAEFMTNMFKVSDPSQARGNTITAREILDKSSKEIDTELAKDPELQAQLMQVMGQVYGNLGLYGVAHGLLTRAVETRRDLFGLDNPQTLSSIEQLGWNLDKEGRYSEAENLQREALDAQRRVLGPKHPNTLEAMSNLAWSFKEESRYAEAERLQREVLELRSQALGWDHPDTVASMTELAASLSGQGHFAEAEKLEKEALEVQRRVLGPEHPQTLMSMNNLGTTLSQEGHYAEAEKLQRETLDLQRRILGLQHPDTYRSMINLADTLQQERRYAEAEIALREAIDVERRVLGPKHPLTLSAMNNLVNTLNKEGRWAEAEKVGRNTLQIRQRVLGPEHRSTLMSMENLAYSLMGEGHLSDAEKLQRNTIEIQRRVLGPEHPDTGDAMYTLAVIEEHEGKRDEALKTLRDAIEHGLPPEEGLDMETDPDLKSLHGDPRFAALVAQTKKRTPVHTNP